MLVTSTLPNVTNIKLIHSTLMLTETYLIDEVVSQCMHCHRSDLGRAQLILHIL